MEFEVKSVTIYDKMRRVKPGMRGYIQGIAYEYLNHKCYVVHLYDYGMYYLYDNAVQIL